MSQDVRLECAVCQYQTAPFGDLVNHPCQQRQGERQHRPEKRSKSITTTQKCFEMEQLRQLEHLNPAAGYMGGGGGNDGTYERQELPGKDCMRGRMFPIQKRF